MMSFLAEFWAFLRQRKRYWLLPIILVLVEGRPRIISSIAGRTRYE